jgi:ribonuclease HII
MTLKNRYSDLFPEAGCDEAGRGCLAGPVYAAAVILPPDYFHPVLTDSKKLTEKQRDLLRKDLETHAIDFAVARLDAPEIDKLNILWASVKTMHLALDLLQTRPQHILIDGNKFKPYAEIPHQCVVGGDALYASIAAASILAKTYRDEYMMSIHGEFPEYCWDSNKGYPTDSHRKAIMANGPCLYHRKSFQLYAGGRHDVSTGQQGTLPL